VFFPGMQIHCNRYAYFAEADGFALKTIMFRRPADAVAFCSQSSFIMDTSSSSAYVKTWIQIMYSSRE
jgi:hypothetical protein